MFWLYVGGVLAVVLISAWLYDRRRKAPSGGIKGPLNDEAVGRAKVDRFEREISNGFRGP